MVSQRPGRREKAANPSPQLKKKPDGPPSRTWHLVDKITYIAFLIVALGGLSRLIGSSESANLTDVVREKTPSSPAPIVVTTKPAAAVVVAATTTTTTTTTAAAVPATTTTTTTTTIAPEVLTAESNILFIHIGRTGGQSFIQNTALHCISEFPDANDSKRAECIQAFPEDMKLARHTQQVLHVQGLEPSAIAKASHFVLAMRDPIDRIVSAYRFAHPDNCQPEIKDRHLGCRLQDKGTFDSGVGHTIYKYCFPSAAMEDFVQATLPPWPTTTGLPAHWVSQQFTTADMEECRKLARQTVRGMLANPIDVHMANNYVHFAALTYRNHPATKLYAYRTETLVEDMKAIDRLLGGKGEIKDPTVEIGKLVEHYKPSPLSTGSLHKLCCVLWEELREYFEIFHHAINLSPDDRLKAVDRLRGTCGLAWNDPWDAWIHTCQELMGKPFS